MKYAVLSLVLWLVLAGASEESFIIGLPAILLAASTAVWLSGAKTNRLSIVRTIPFSLFFIRNSLMGGVDVACRAVLPRMPLDPGFLEYTVHLNSDSARVFFANAVSLLPGTLSANLQGDLLIVHVLDKSQSNELSLRRLERQVGKLFGLETNLEAKWSAPLK